MTSRVEEVFEQAMDVPLDQRAQLLDRVCGNDSEVRRRVEALLGAHDSHSGFLPEAPLHGDLPGRKHDEGVTPENHTEDQVGSIVDRFRLLERIGEGGFGVVWAAQQLEPVARRVAVKIIKPGMDTKQVIARFEAERQALALMDHPNVASVLDAGTTKSGRPYFVMELIRGICITEYCDQKKLSTEQRVRLFNKTCNAVQHAHQKGIIHRDIKPTNVLVTLYDGVPIPKVIDFGIAKATQGKLTDKTVYTQLQHFVGSPAYMSPEQAEMSGLDVDIRSDVYSLGVLLYELLTGHTPFDAKELLAAGLDEMRRIIRDQEPPKPSARITTLPRKEQSLTTTRRGLSHTPKLVSSLTGDLDWIVLKCLEKDRTRRYETVNALAQDLSRHLDHEPVKARPPSTIYRLQKLWRRRRVAVITTVMIAAALLTATGFSLWQASRAVQASADAERNLYAARMSLIQEAWGRNDILRIRELLQETATYVGRGFEWYFWQQQSRLERKTLRGHWDRVDAVVYSADGQRVYSAGGRVDGSGDYSVRVWDVATGNELPPLVGHTGLVVAMAMSADGATLFTGGYDSTVRVWNLKTGRGLYTLRQHSESVRSVSVSRDGLLASGDSENTIVVWDISDLSREPSLLWKRESQGPKVDVSPDGTKLIVCSFKKSLMRLLDARHGDLLYDFPIRPDNHAVLAEFSPDGRRIISSHRDQSITIWLLDGQGTYREASSVRGHVSSGFLGALAFSHDGKRFASGSDDQSIKIWDSETGRELRTLRGHSGRIRGVAFSPDGRQLASASHDSTVKLWDADLDQDSMSVSMRERLHCLAFEPNCQRFVAGGEEQVAVIQDVSGAEKPIRLVGHKAWVFAAAFSPDGQHVVTGSEDGTAILWNGRDGRRLATFVHGDRVVSLAFSSDGRQIVTGGWDGRGLVWDVSDAKVPIARLDGHAGPIWSVAWSPSGNRIVTGGEDQSARVWDVPTGQQLLGLNGHSGAIRSVAWTRFGDGRELVLSAGVDGTARVWNAVSGKRLLTLAGHHEPIWSASFSPSGDRVVTASGGPAVRVWDTRNGREMLTFDGSSNGIVSAQFTADGRSVLAGFINRRIRRWKAISPEQLAAQQQAETLDLLRVAAARRNAMKRLERETDHHASPPGAITNWLVLSPLRVSPSDSDFDAVRSAMDTSHIPEHEISSGIEAPPRAGSSIMVDNRAMIWRAARLDDYVLKFDELLGEGTYWPSSVGYALCYIHSDKVQTDLQLKVGWDDFVKIYLNGKEEFASGGNSFAIDSHTVTGLRLEPGRNILLVKVGNGIGYWRCSLRFTDGAGHPFRGFRATLDPTVDFSPPETAQ